MSHDDDLFYIVLYISLGVVLAPTSKGDFLVIMLALLYALYHTGTGQPNLIFNDVSSMAISLLSYSLTRYLILGDETPLDPW